MPEWSRGPVTDILKKNQASKPTAQGRPRIMDEMKQPRAPELRLLLACARAHLQPEREAAIRELLCADVDWTLFVRKAVAHGLAGLAGHTLGRVAPDLVPDEILAAFQAFIAQTRESNLGLLEELARLVELLAAAGVTTIPFKGPVLAQQAFGDLGLRGFRDLDFLIRDEDLAPAIKALDAFGYQRQGGLTETQFNLIHWLQGQEILFKKDACAIEPHTRLTSVKMALGIDYDGLWSRARRGTVFGHEMLTFSPEDTLLVLAIHGGKELWWDIKWACDIADFIAAHPGLDWTAIIARARAQGCYRVLLVATALSRQYLGAKIPASLATAEARDPIINQIIGRILARWEADDPGGPPSNKTLSMDRLRLHDGVFRRASYVIRTLFLPGPQHIPLMALPSFLGFAYIPLGLAHDLLALPLYRLYRWFLAQADRMRGVMALSPIVSALTPMSSQERQRLKKHQRVLASATRAAAANPKDSGAWTAMADALAGLKRYERAVACYDKSLAIIPDRVNIWRKRSLAIAALKKTTPSSSLKEEPEFDVLTAEGWSLRAGFLWTIKRYSDAVEASECALRLDPSHEAAIRIGIASRLYACDWTRRDDDKRIIKESLGSGAVIMRPMNFKQVFDSEDANLWLAQSWNKKQSRMPKPLWRGERYDHRKIRIAYLSTDFRSHPVGHTILGPLKHHDKNGFEITAISMGPDDKSAVREQVKAAADRFIDATTLDDEAVSAMIRDLEIDIAVDLNGLTGNRRADILARRPAPVQVNYMGYPGTTAAPFLDYIIADPVVIPEENRAFYTEKIAYLPNAYLPYDSKRNIRRKTPSRSEQGLPETGFVFACFNNLYKVSPEMFEVWMRLLHAVEGSVLWLAETNSPAAANLRREAAARDIEPERLIFARYEKEAEDHLARQALADLFLDTLPYNAHSTGNDALWAGLPLLTCLGQAFPGRVAASLLHAIGLPDLVTGSLAEYEERALALARDPKRLAALRDHLARNRDTHPLFDTARYTRDLEAIYRTMWQRQQADLPPETFCVANSG